MITMALPFAWSNPAVIAIWCPKLRESRSTRNRLSCSCRPRMISKLPSALPSSKSTTSVLPSSRAITSVNWRARSGRDPASSWTGMTNEYSGAVMGVAGSGTANRRLTCAGRVVESRH